MDREEDPPHPLWVVTARHNIQEARAEGARMFLRVNRKDSYVDLLTSPDDWHEDDEHDVAVAYWNGDGVGAVITAVPLDQFVTDDYRYHGSQDDITKGLRELGGQPIKVGHEVFFVGLFNQHAGKAKNLPIARFGSVARLPTESISVGREDGSVEKLHGYLVEARSWGGHSGSPVFWYYPGAQVDFLPDPRPTPPGNRATRRKGFVPKAAPIPVSHELGIVALLGLVSAHFDIPQTAEIEGDVIGRVVTRLNAGIAVVTPAHVIRALLGREDVLAEKDVYREKAKEQEEPVASFDYVSEGGEADLEFDRFQDLTRKIVGVPKKEIDEKRKGES